MFIDPYAYLSSSHANILHITRAGDQIDAIMCIAVGAFPPSPDVVRAQYNLFGCSSRHKRCTDHKDSVQLLDSDPS